MTKHFSNPRIINTSLSVSTDPKLKMNATVLNRLRIMAVTVAQHAVSLWNSLDNSVKLCDSVPTFKRKLMANLLGAFLSSQF